MTKKESSIARQPFTDEELEAMNYEDYAKAKLTEDERVRLRKIKQMLEAEQAERTLRVRKEAEPLVHELRQLGLNIDSVWRLVSRSIPYTEAIPILLRHLTLPYCDVTKDGIARSLAVPEPEVRRAWPTLVDEYRKAPSGKGFIAPGDSKQYQLGAKNGLACALAVAVTDETLPELISLAKDRALGESRLLLLSALKNRRKKSPLAAQAVAELAEDPDLKKEIAAWK